MSLIQLSQVNIYLPEQEEPLLKDINFKIEAGEWVTLVGKNGCGKSVLGKLIAGLNIRFNGEIQGSDKASSFQLVMQNPDSQLVGETVWEDICFGLESQGIPVEMIKEKAAIALKSVGLSGFESRSVQSLSGGQKQLLAIAGAIALKPSAIIADEITSMLDPTSRSYLMGVLRELNSEGITIIMITQLLEELAFSERIIAIDNGTLVYDGGKEGFFYNECNQGKSVCEEIGLVPPYTVQVAKRMLDQGIQLNGCPILPNDLLKAVVLE